MKKVIIAILTGPFYRCLYAKDLFVDKIGQLMNYALPVKEVSHNGDKAVLQVNETIRIVFKLTKTGYVEDIDVEDIE